MHQPLKFDQQNSPVKCETSSTEELTFEQLAYPPVSSSVSVPHTGRNLSDLCLLDHMLRFPIEILCWKIHPYLDFRLMPASKPNPEKLCVYTDLYVNYFLTVKIQECPL